MIGEAILARTILALDTPNLGQACDWVQQYRERVYAFKVGGALAIGHGLPIVRTLREAGAERVFRPQVPRHPARGRAGGASGGGVRRVDADAPLRGRDGDAAGGARQSLSTLIPRC